MDNSHKSYEPGNREWCATPQPLAELPLPNKTSLSDLIIDDWVCRICGSVHYLKNSTNYECSGCSIIFGNPRKMNLPKQEFLN